MTRLSQFIAYLLLLVIALTSALTAYAAEDKASALAGAALFRDKGCSYCHGTSGLGTTRGPSLANVRKKLKPPQIASQILNGGQRMPPFSDSLSEDEVGQLVAYLRTKNRPAAPMVKTLPPANPNDSKPLSNPEQ